VLPIDLGKGLQVQDVSVSMFIEAERDWFLPPVPAAAHAE